MGVIKWYVEASYANHNDCQPHTDAIMTFGGGAMTSFSQQQKLNAKSSTEAELIGVDEALPQILWTWYFLEELEYTLTSNIIHQDDEKAMIMETHGNSAYLKHTEHIKV